MTIERYEQSETPRMNRSRPAIYQLTMTDEVQAGKSWKPFDNEVMQEMKMKIICKAMGDV